MTSALIALALAASPNTMKTTLHEFTMKRIDGAETPLSKFKDKVVLVVNVASKCGLTPQYKGLQGLYDKYSEKGFTILAFPANDFKGQEPGTNAEIAEFCKVNYGVTFPVFEKIAVTGDSIHPLYKWLVDSTDRKDAIEWNFAKFLIGKDGKVIARFTPKTAPDDPALVSAIEGALNAD